MATNTAPSFTFHTAPSSGSTAGPYSISFTYIDEDEVDVTVDGVLKTKTTHYTFASATTIQFTSGNNPANSAAIKFQRDTNIGAKKVDFQDGSVLTETDLDSSTDQLLFGLQELSDDYIRRDGTQTITGDLVFEGSSDDDNETTLAITNPTDDRTITLPDRSGTVITSGDTGTVTSTMIEDGTIVNVDVNASAAIEGTKINPNFGSQNIATTGNISAGGTLGVTGNSTLSGTLGVTGVSTFTGAIDANGGATIDNVQIGVTNDNEIDTSSGNLTIDSAGGTTTIDDALTVSGNATLQGTLGVTGTTTTADITGGAVVTSGTSSSDTKVYSAKRAEERFYGKDTLAEIQSGETWSSADDKVATTAAIDARIIDLVDDVGGFVPIANETSFPTANPDVNNGTGTLVSIKEISTARTPSSGTVTIANGAGTGNTVTINGCGSTVLPAGFGVIVETTTTLHTYTFHRITPKATENTTVAGISSDVTTVAGIASDVTAVANNNANVTTVAGSISNVNNVGGSITSVNNANANLTSINNFGDLYQVAANNPSTDGGGNALAAGDLYFNTSANELKIYNGGAWQAGVTATGNFALTTGNTFTGDNRYNDGVKLLVGTDSDLEIYHDSNNSVIDSNTGNLYLLTANNLFIQGANNENIIKYIANGAVEIYHDNVKKVETSADGLDLPDSSKLQLGDSQDLQIYHNTNSYIDNSTGITFIRNTGTNGSQIQLLNNNSGLKIQGLTGEQSIIANANGSVELYNDNVKKAETSSTGFDVTGDITATGVIHATGNQIKVEGATPKFTLIDNDNNPDYEIQNNGGTLNINDITSGTTRFTVNSDGHVDVAGNLDVGAGLDVTGAITATGGGITATGAVVASGMNLSGDLDFGTHCDIRKKTNTTNAVINGITGHVLQNSLHLDGKQQDIFLECSGKTTFGSADGATHEVMRVQNSVLGNSTHGKVFLNYVTANAGGNTSSANKLTTESYGISVTGNIAVTGTVDNRDVAADGTKLDGIETGATADQTASEITTLLSDQNIYTTGNIGRDAGDYISFTTDTQMDVFVNGNNEFRFEADGDFHADGDVIAESTTISSDERLKENIEIVSDPIEKIETLRGVTFDWKRDGKKSAGVIAQDVEKVLPEAVKEVQGLKDDESYKTVNYNALISILIESVKELSARVKELEEK